MPADLIRLGLVLELGLAFGLGGRDIDRRPNRVRVGVTIRVSVWARGSRSCPQA